LFHRVYISPILAALALFINGIAVTAPVFALGDDDKVLNLGDFKKINVTGVYDLEVKRGSSYEVRISGKPVALERAQIKVDGQTLYLGHRRKGRGYRGFKNSKSIRANITLPNLEELTVSGVVDGDIRDVDADVFTINISGVGDVRISGTCNRLNARLSGVGDLNARKLECKSAEVKVSGVGDARVYASEDLNAFVSGIGDLTCYGSPKNIRKNRTFFSSIRVY